MSSWAALIGEYQIALQASLAAELIVKQAEQESAALCERGMAEATAQQLAGLEAARRRAVGAQEALELAIREIRAEPELLDALKSLANKAP